MKMPWLQSWCLILLIAVLPAVAQGRQVFGFKAPDSIDAPEMPAVMRDLAERVLPVYQDNDSDRYLANLSALQWADSNYKARSEERRVGKECVSTCRSRWSALLAKKTNNNYNK